MEYFPGQAFFKHKRDNELVVGGYSTDKDDNEELFSSSHIVCYYLNEWRMFNSTWNSLLGWYSDSGVW